MQESGAAGKADLIIVNSCTVTNRTDQQVRQAVRRAHRDNPCARLVVTGRYAERDPESLAALPGVSLVIGSAERDYLLSPAPPTRGKTRPFVKLQDGCGAHCSYCIVPSVRGPGRSAHPEDILARIRSLIGQGYHEIVLTGVRLGTYGRTLAGGMKLLDLLGRILDLPGLGRLRLSSVEPMRFDLGIVRLAAGSPAFAPHFHRSFIGRGLRGITLAKEEEMGEGVVLTENYIHARVAMQGLAPNRPVTVRKDEATPQLSRATVI